MTNSPRPPKFPAAHVRPPQPAPFGLDEKARAEHERAELQRVVLESAIIETQRLDMLARHYGLKRGQFPLLAQLVARDYVPGFRAEHAPKKRGPKPAVAAAFDLIAEVDLLRVRDRLSIAAACEVLRTDRAGKWRGEINLERRYHRARDTSGASEIGAVYLHLWDLFRTQRCGGDGEDATRWNTLPAPALYDGLCQIRGSFEELFSLLGRREVRVDNRLNGRKSQKKKAHRHNSAR